MHSFISVTVDNNSIFELSRELMIVIIVLSAVLVVTCAITVSSVCIVIIVKCKKEKRKRSVRRKPSWRKNARIKRGIPTHTVQPEPPVYIEILPDLKAPRSSATRSGSSDSNPQTPPISVPVRCTKSTNPSNVHSLEDNTYVNIGLRRTATQTGVSKVSKSVPQPYQESDIPLDANELYDILQPREKEEEEEEEEEEQEYIEMTSLRQDIQMNWNSAYRKLEVYNIVQN